MKKLKIVGWCILPLILYVLASSSLGGMVGFVFSIGIRLFMPGADMVELFKVNAVPITAIVSVPLGIAMLGLSASDRKGKRLRGLDSKLQAREWIKPFFMGSIVGIGLNTFLGLIRIDLLFPEYAQFAKETFYTPHILWQIIGIGIIIPFAEETLFREAFYERVRLHRGIIGTTLITSIFFGLYHGNPVQFIYAGLMGIYLAYLKEGYQDIKAPILFHMGANLASVAITNLGSQEGVHVLEIDSLLENTTLLIITCISLIALIATILITVHIIRSLISQSKKENVTIQDNLEEE